MIPRLLTVSSATFALHVSISSGFSAAWLSPPSWRNSLSGVPHADAAVRALKDSAKDIVDVDFERVDSDSIERDTYDQSSSSIDNSQVMDDRKQNLFDISLDADQRWKTTRIPFCRGDEYIDAKLAFMVELEGVQYGIAVPFDDAVAIIVQERNQDNSENDKKNSAVSVTYVDPDKYDENDEYQELMEIMAAQVQKELGEEFMLRKTPKVLTISGGLGRITDNWEQSLLGKPAPADDFLKSFQLGEESLDEEINDFMAFMRNELGDEEFEKTLRDEPDEDDQLLMKLFDIPGLGDRKDDKAGLEELIKSMEDDLDDDKGVNAQAKQFEPDTGGLSLKLISFEFPNSAKSYSLVKLLEPYVLVGKYCEVEGEPGFTVSDEGNQEFVAKDVRFDLLSSDEERLLIPKLERLCQKDLADAGLSFLNSARKSKEMKL